MRPHVSVTCRTACAIWAESVTSAPAASASPPSARMTDGGGLGGDRSISIQATLAPSRA